MIFDKKLIRISFIYYFYSKFEDYRTNRAFKKEILDKWIINKIFKLDLLINKA